MRDEAAIDAVRRELEREPGVVAAIVFGSVARGQARDGSDLDVAVRWASIEARDAAARDILTWLGRLGRAAGRDVQVVDLERADPALVRRICDEGIWLFDRDPSGTRRLASERILEHFDWEHARRIIDEAHERRLGRRG